MASRPWWRSERDTTYTWCMSWRLQNMLFHYTSSAEVVGKILRNGLLLVPNRRELANLLLGRSGFERREPQQFGMVSFTELPRDRARSHRESFGEFGIGVTWQWAERHGAQRVIYIGNGTVLDTFAWLFRLAVQQLERECPEPVSEAILINKVAAGIYSQMYAKLLNIYEYMEPDRNSDQVEWRIVNAMPQYHDLSDRAKLISRLSHDAEQGAGNSVRLIPDDVEMLVCPHSRISELRDAIPAEFRNVPIVPIAARDTLASAVRAMFRIAESNLRRRRPEQRHTVGKPVCGDKNCGPRVNKLASVHELPRMKKLNGLLVNCDELLEASFCTLQYEDCDKRIVDLKMSLEHAIILYSYLNRAVQNQKIREHAKAIAKMRNE